MAFPSCCMINLKTFTLHFFGFGQYPLSNLENLDKLDNQDNLDNIVDNLSVKCKL